MSFGESYKPMSEEQREAGRRADDELLEKQHEALVEQLQREGRFNAADLVRDLVDNLRIARTRIAALTAKPKKQTVKTSGGRDRASAKGTITSNEVTYGGYARVSAGGKAVNGSKGGNQGHQHKHDYGSDGKCIKVVAGVPCPAQRQRQSKKSRQTVIPGTDGAKPAATSEAGS